MPNFITDKVLMHLSTLTKTVILGGILSSALILSACSETPSDTNDRPTATKAQTQSTASKNWPSLQTAMNCLSKTGPIISQHRGRTKEDQHAENSLSALKALRKNGFIMAEIDVTRLKDGRYILFHDGVWDDHSTGKGPLARTDWGYAQNLLLKNHRGKLQSDRPVTLDQVLSWADHQLYFEIDFKSSADEKAVVAVIKSAGMERHVALIAYNKKQAVRLARLSPNSMITAPIRTRSDIKYYLSNGIKKGNLVAWLGTKDYNPSLVKTLKSKNIITAYGMLSPRYNKIKSFKNLDIVVTDYAAEAKNKTNIKAIDKHRLQACL